MRSRKFDYHDKALLTGAGIVLSAWWYMVYGAFLVLLLVLVMPDRAGATTYYVRVEGDDAANGQSWATAWRTVGKVNSLIGAGDTVRFGKGAWYGDTLKIPRTQNSADRTCFECTTIVNPFLRENPPCTLSSAVVVPGSSLSWTMISPGFYRAYYVHPYNMIRESYYDGNGSDYSYSGGEDTTMMQSCEVMIASAPAGSYQYDERVDTLYVKTFAGDSPTGHTYYIGWGPLAFIRFNDSTKQYFTIRGFDLRWHVYGAVIIHGSCDSIFVENCKVTRIGTDGGSNSGVIGTQILMSYNDPTYMPGKYGTYLWDSRYTRIKNCWAHTFLECFDDGDNARPSVITTYSQSYCVVESTLSENIGGWIHWKNQGGGGYTYGNCAKYNISINTSQTPYWSGSWQGSDSCYGNVIIGSGTDVAVFYNQGRAPYQGGSFIQNNTVYGWGANLIQHPGGCAGAPILEGGEDSIYHIPPNKIKYNIFMDNNTSASYTWYFRANQTDTNWAVDSNIYYNVDTTGTPYVSTPTGSCDSEYRTFAQWRARQSGAWYTSGERRHDYHSTFATNPGFANPSINDFSRPSATPEMNLTYGGRTWTLYGAWQADTGTADPHINLSTSTLTFNAVENDPTPADQNFTVSNTGGGTLNWSIGDNQTWISEAPTSGDDNSHSITVSISTTALTPGTYNATITVSSTNADNSPQTIAVTYTVSAAGGEPDGGQRMPHFRR